MPVSEAEYRRLLAQEEGRRAGPQTSRDDAVRRANIAAGYGNSTALRKFGGGSTSPFKIAGGGGKGGGGGRRGGGGGDKTASTKAAPNPNANMTTPTSAPGFLPNMTTPTSAESFYPHTVQPMSSLENPTRSPTSQPGFWDATRGPTTEGGGFSPMRDPSLMWQGATAGAPSTGFPPDLAVSPPHERWPGDTAQRGVDTAFHIGPGIQKGPMDAVLKRMGDENYMSPSQTWKWLFGNMGGRLGGGWG